ncbi:hypothetical protein K8352_12220 [Flavobacteriaceae bacterium F89]|uniref:Uncharacterized protein n=1 Tax=Cerina litoralis TaxID=2874477 RepID=A0AAE3JRM4_9FLAO|nr:hypothetical protein [Cerina litoralis]MCG2461518.1 hypothetical protein [Cerina litoralis]
MLQTRVPLREPGGVHDLKIEDNTADDATAFHKQIVDVLVKQGCSLITLTFNTDGKLVLESTCDECSVDNS